MKHWFLQLFSRVLQTRSVMVFAPIVGALAVVFVLALGAATPVAAQSTTPPASCYEAMAPGASPIAVDFVSTTYTVTVPGGFDVCLDSGFNLMAGFIGQVPFAVNGEGASKMPEPEVDYLYGLGPISGTLKFDITAPDTHLVLTDINSSGGTMLVWLGELQAATAAPATPAPSAKATSLRLMKAGEKVTTLWNNGNKPFWGPFTPQVTGELKLEVTASVAFTMTSAVGYADVPAQVCGDNCWKAVVPADGSWETPELKGLYWTDLLVGPEDARVLVPAPVTTTASSTSASTTDDKKPGGGAADGEAPALWAVSSVRHYMPLIRKP